MIEHAVAKHLRTRDELGDVRPLVAQLRLVVQDGAILLLGPGLARDGGLEHVVPAV
jgi:hypothetical protein